jgi:hypothetical protein
MDAPNNVVEQVRAHQQLERSINEGFERLEKKILQVADALTAMPDSELKFDLIKRFAEMEKLIDRNVKAFGVSTHNAKTVLDELKSPKPNWLVIERALDRSLEVSARIDADVKNLESALDDVLAACRAGS